MFKIFKAATHHLLHSFILPFIHSPHQNTPHQEKLIHEIFKSHFESEKKALKF